jgi:hypothetical protein
MMERKYQPSCSSPRSRSAPRGGKSPRTPNTFYAFPSTLQDIIYGPRQRLTKYADGMRTLPTTTPPTPALKEEAEAAHTNVVEVEAVALPPAVEVADAAGVAAPARPPEKKKDVPEPAPVAAEESTTVGKGEGDGAKEEAEEMVIPGEAETPATASAAAAAASSEEPPSNDQMRADEGNEGAVAARGEEENGKVETAETAAEESEMGTAETVQHADADAESAAADMPPQQPQQREQQQSSPPESSEHVEGEEKEDKEEPAELPQLRATVECVAFDPAQIEALMANFRHDTAHVPAGVDAFVHHFDQIASKFNLKIVASSGVGGAGSVLSSPLTSGAAGKKGKKASSGFALTVGSPKSFGQGPLPLELPSREGGFGGAVAPHPVNGGGGGAGSNAGRKTNALEALGEVWEGRQETPISLAQGSLRRRGLFGEVEKKQLHHMVVAVLNKVTTDPVKFREVKNELLRLPIPEANAEQLEKIVDAFFTKAVREQHFSHSYADLIVALCKVPQGQHIVGDKTQSLEYRLRVALLKRCQSEFVQSVKAETHGSQKATTTTAADGAVSSPLTATVTNAEEAGGETEKERRDRMCGNVRFVCELFLRDVVVGTVISFIFRVCLLGSEFGEFAVPPGYTPTESQVDEVITAVRTVRERYFVRNVEGRRMLPLVLGQLDYWVQHYPVSRCRFLLMSIVEELRAMLPAPELMAVAPLTIASSVNADCPVTSVPVSQPPPSQELALVPSTTTTIPTPFTVSPAPHRPTVPREVFEPAPSSPPAAALSVVDGSQSPVTSTMVGGQPLPAPRSRQAGNISVSESLGSFAGSAPQVESSVVASPLLALALTLSSRPLLQAVRAEAVAKFMAALAGGQSTAKDIATQLFDQYGNVLPVLSAWLDRCLSVAKEEKARKQTGAVLVACAEHLTAHLSSSSREWGETMAACQTQLHEIAIESLQRALEAKLYEDLHIFQFWAQLILSDHDRVIYDEELLNEGLELIAYTAPAALHNYLVEVGKYMNQVLLKPDSLPWHPATEEHNFVRYRPLLVMHSLAPNGGLAEAQDMLDNVLSFADVRQQSLEMRLYHAFRNGTPSHEVVFEQLRSAPRLTSRDPTLAAEVLSALLIAELSSDGVALVENNMDLIQITVDGVNRGNREMALVAEVYEVLRYTRKSPPRTAAARVLRKFVFMHILSDETMERADRFYEAEREGVIEKPEKDSRGVLEAPPLPPSSTSLPLEHAAVAGGGGGAAAAAFTAPPDVPRIADRPNAEEAALSESTSLRSTSWVNHPSNTHGSAEGPVVDFRTNTGATNSAEGIPSSNTSSLAEFRPPNVDRHGPNTSRHRNTNNSSGNTSQRKQDDNELSSRHSVRQTSPTRKDGDASKQLYRNSYKNRRRSHENNSELPSSAGGSKDASPQQLPVAHTPPSTYENSSLENSRIGSGSTSHYGRGSSHHHPNHNSTQNSSNGGGGSRGGSRGGGRGGRGGRGGGGGSSNGGSHRGGARGGSSGGRGGHDDTQRGNSRYGPRGGGGSRE